MNNIVKINRNNEIGIRNRLRKRKTKLNKLSHNSQPVQSLHVAHHIYIYIISHQILYIHYLFHTLNELCTKVSSRSRTSVLKPLCFRDIGPKRRLFSCAGGASTWGCRETTTGVFVAGVVVWYLTPEFCAAALSPVLIGCSAGEGQKICVTRREVPNDMLQQFFNMIFS